MQPILVRPRSRLALAIALAAGSAHAATVTVNSNDDSASSTSCNLRSAIASIEAGGSTQYCASQIVGPFGSNDTVQFDVGLANATITLTQGEILIASGKSFALVGSGQTIDGNAASRILHVQIQPMTLTASNLTLTHGNSGANGGGAIAIDVGGSSLALSTVTISNNESGTTGGAMFLNHVALNLTNSTISGNTAAGAGSGIYAFAGTTTITNSTVSSNAAVASSGGAGAIAVAYGNNLSIDRSVISGNTAKCTYYYCGAGIRAYQSTVNVIDTTISGNTASGNEYNMAGGAYLHNSASTFVNSTIAGNSAKGNKAVVGGLWEQHATTQGGSLTLINCTVSANTASSYLAPDSYIGGGIMSGFTNGGSGSAGSLSLVNSIVSANLPANSDIVLGSGDPAPTSAYSLLGTASNVAAFNSASNHNVFSDTPGLGPLQANGGPTQTMALTSTSPAWRVGNPTLAVYSGVPLNYDQRGASFERLFSGLVDMGAYQDQGDRIFVNGFETTP